MAHITADRVKDTTTTTGTGDITLANSAPTGFRTLNAVASTNDTFFYALEGGAEWEVGLGTYSGSHVFVRTTVLASSNSGSSVNFSAGTKNFFITLPASKIADNTAYASSWDGDTATAPSKNAVYDKFEELLGAPTAATRWFIPETWKSITTLNNSALVANTIYLVPFAIYRACTISDLGAAIGTASSGNSVKLAIYATASSGEKPTGTPLAETGDISTTSTGAVSADITGANVTLNPGKYWAAFWSNNSVAALISGTRAVIGPGPLLVGSGTLGNIINASGQGSWYLTNSATYAASFPDLTSASFSEDYGSVGGNRGYIIALKKT